MITPAAAEQILAYLEDFQDYQIIIKAIKKASTANKRRSDYIDGILRSWKNKGYKVLTDLQDEQKQDVKIETKEETEEEKIKRKTKELEESLKNDRW